MIQYQMMGFLSGFRSSIGNPRSVPVSTAPKYASKNVADTSSHL